MRRRGDGSQEFIGEEVEVREEEQDGRTGVKEVEDRRRGSRRRTRQRMSLTCSLSASLFTLFQVVTGDSWASSVARTLFVSEDGGVDLGVAFFFVSYVLLAGVVLINIVVAVRRRMGWLFVRAGQLRAEGRCCWTSS